MRCSIDDCPQCEPEAVEARPPAPRRITGTLRLRFGKKGATSPASSRSA
jgi:hypothetical protein